MKTLIIILSLVFFSTSMFAQSEQMVESKILTDRNGEFLNIKAVANNNTKVFQDLNYILITLKQGASGTSSNKQSGKFTLSPDENKQLAQSSIRITEKDALKVFLLIKDNETDRLVSKDSLQINLTNFEKTATYIPETSIEPPGLTIDDTKTRLGQIFYHAFFRKYNQFTTKFEGTITISEVPAFGRSSRIMISQDDQVVYAFMAKPDEEFLEGEANKSLSILQEMQKRNSLRNRDFKY